MATSLATGMMGGKGDDGTGNVAPVTPVKTWKHDPMTPSQGVLYRDNPEWWRYAEGTPPWKYLEPQQMADNDTRSGKHVK